MGDLLSQHVSWGLVARVWSIIAFAWQKHNGFLTSEIPKLSGGTRFGQLHKLDMPVTFILSNMRVLDYNSGGVYILRPVGYKLKTNYLVQTTRVGQHPSVCHLSGTTGICTVSFMDWLALWSSFQLEPSIFFSLWHFSQLALHSPLHLYCLTEIQYGCQKFPLSVIIHYC